VVETLADGARDAGCVEPAIREELLRVAVLDEVVGQAQVQQRHGNTGLREAPRPPRKARRRP